MLSIRRVLMGKFKAGDRVRCIVKDYWYDVIFNPDDEVTVIRGSSKNGGTFTGPDGVLLYDCRWELIEQPSEELDFSGHIAPAGSDAVFRPSHYARYPIEPITFITANGLGFLPGNVIKYVLRHDAKDGLQDLQKARRYIDIMIEDVERKERGEALKVETV